MGSMHDVNWIVSMDPANMEKAMIHILGGDHVGENHWIFSPQLQSCDAHAIEHCDLADAFPGADWNARLDWIAPVGSYVRIGRILR